MFKKELFTINGSFFYTDKSYEINEIYRFVEKNYEYFDNINFNDLISIINIFQHHGFPTRVYVIVTQTTKLRNNNFGYRRIWVFDFNWIL